MGGVGMRGGRFGSVAGNQFELLIKINARKRTSEERMAAMHAPWEKPMIP
jgi:hypothetical protein